jgi:hypothetical protein
MSKSSRFAMLDDSLETFPEGMFTHDETVDLNAAIMRQYFEGGCLCIHSGKLAVLSSQTPDAEAVLHYERNCRCSRNYEIDSIDSTNSSDRAGRKPDSEVPF